MSIVEFSKTFRNNIFEMMGYDAPCFDRRNDEQVTMRGAKGYIFLEAYAATGFEYNPVMLERALDYADNLWSLRDYDIPQFLPVDILLNNPHQIYDDEIQTLCVGEPRPELHDDMTFNPIPPCDRRQVYAWISDKLNNIL